jgi:deoxyribose-phosphate aldolase
MAIDTLTIAQLAACIDHTCLRPDATAADIEKLCSDALRNKFHGVCVNGCWVDHARVILEESDVKIVCVVGFPLGAMSGDVKRFEAEAAIDDGAQEIDLVINIGHLKDGRNKLVLRELRDVVEAADERTVKVILETALLTQEEKIRACQLVMESGAQFVQTSTGFTGGGATLEDVRLLRDAVGLKFGGKASGGIRDVQMALAMIEAGANRLGTSAGVAILEDIETTSRETTRM